MIGSQRAWLDFDLLTLMVADAQQGPSLCYSWRSEHRMDIAYRKPSVSSFVALQFLDRRRRDVRLAPLRCPAAAAEQRLRSVPKQRDNSFARPPEKICTDLHRRVDPHGIGWMHERWLLSRTAPAVRTRSMYDPSWSCW